MTTFIEERVTPKTRVWPELKQLPHEALRVPLVVRKGHRVRMPRGLTCQLATSPPSEAWPRIMEGIQDFGLHNLYIYAPKEAFRVRNTDPAVIAERGGKFYLIAVWE